MGSGQAGNRCRRKRWALVVDAALLAGALSVPAGIAVGTVRTTVEPVVGSIHVVDVEPPSTGPPVLAPPQTSGPTPGAGPVLGQAQQELAVAIRSGGPLRVTPSEIAVVLHRDGDRLVGHLGPVQLVDPRGTLAGWHVVASFAAPGTGAVLLVPGPPTAVSGRQSEVTAGRSESLRGNHRVVLMSAAPGGGGGTFSISPTIVVRHPGPSTVRTVLVTVGAY